ncbi:MAG: prepilin-type N-terminal cleavage/methylation domain-containing protein [Gammaproteobacteria bacterium]|nr:prepilin-type N-terminal cleavage/methylation domain-containing protein [Gammaproteobacteria bacterium]
MKKQQGFTLIELAIVVAIIGILSVVAFGFYGDYVISSNRTEGRAALQTASGTLEKCRSLYGAYNNASCNYADFQTTSGYYDITDAINATGTTFTLTATPVVGSPQANDADCTTLTLTNTNTTGATGADTTVCW